MSSINKLWAGDLFVYAPIEEFLSNWNPTTWYPAENGLEAFCRSILLSYGCDINVQSWETIFSNEILHLNVPSLGLVDVDCITKWNQSNFAESDSRDPFTMQ